jgi:hypothetical protein
MSDLTITLSVTTPDLDDIDGPLTGSAGYAEVVSYDPGGVTKRRQLLRSPTVRGARQQSSVPDQRQMTLRLRIFGSSKSALDAHVQTWLNVFEQTRYHTSITIQGVETEWACDDADYNLVSETGEGVDKYRLMAAPLRQIWEFRIPTDPDPTVGVF